MARKPKGLKSKINIGEKPIKLLPAPKVDPYQRVKTILRLISALIFAILGFNFANSAFFINYPLFGVNYLDQVLITPIAALIGYFVVFEVVNQIRKWLEYLIINTVVEIVSRFWDLQSKKIQEQRRIKQKTKADTERAKLDEAIKIGIVLDTSVLIDGRIVEIVKLRFLDVPFIIPQEVIDELHLMSDNKDNLKRQKGRRGLDILRELKRKGTIYIKSIKNGSEDPGVDKLLINFCKNTTVKLATLDFNLSKVAAVNGITVLNINALANAIKTVLLPGEQVEIKIIQQGKEKEQGIGYLEDGTMLVIEGAKDKVGQAVLATVTKVIQSPAGKMIFAK